jgi:hypothetical protein
MMQLKSVVAAIAAAAFVAACGDGGGDNLGTVNSSAARGALVQSPPVRTTSMSALDFTASLQASGSGQVLIQLAGTPACGVDVQYLKYGTVGAKGEATTSTGALMVPTGAGAKCTGPRPILLFGHGTNISKAYNLADFADKTNEAYGQAVMLAAFYAAQGYIVVAPNYAGYADSTLPYHPYLNADQVSKEMIDALAAAKTALPSLPASVQASGKLFISGYSQGGHAAMATHREMQRLGMPVTASAPMSGPYAMAAMGDAVFFGSVNLSSTIFIPFAIGSYQQAYGDMYTTPSDIYETAFAAEYSSVLPGTYNFDTIISTGKVPATALFSSTTPAPGFEAYTPPSGNPLFALGFGTGNLIKNSARLSYLMDAMANPDGAVPPTTGAQAGAPQSPFRKALKKNDLRDWTPHVPVLLCGGNGDPVAYYSLNTELMQGLWSTPGSPLQVASPALLTVLDVDSLATSTGPATDPFYAAKYGFAQAKSNTAAAAGADPVAQATNVMLKYHGELVPPFCTAAARGFFSQF